MTLHGFKVKEFHSLSIFFFYTHLSGARSFLLLSDPCFCKTKGPETLALWPASWGFQPVCIRMNPGVILEAWLAELLTISALSPSSTKSKTNN